MSNNDWEQPGSNPNVGHAGAQQPAPPLAAQAQPPSFQGAGSASGAASTSFTEGWGTGATASFDELKARFGLVFKRAKGSILKAWLALSILPLIFAILGGVLSIVGYYLPGVAFVGAIGTMILSLILMPLTLALSVAQMALFRPMHARIFEDAREQMGVLDTIKSVKGVFVATLLVCVIVGFGTSVGLLFCILPGLFIGFMLSQSIYLAAGRGLGPMDAVTQSFELTKAHFVSVAMVVGALFCMGIVVAMVVFPMSLVAAFIAPFGDLISGVVNWGIVQVFSFSAFLLQTTVFSVIESKETGRMPV